MSAARASSAQGRNGRRESHTRTNSDEIPRMVHGQPNGNFAPENFPPQQPPHPYYHHSFAALPPPLPAAAEEHPGTFHQRTRSWSGSKGFSLGQHPQAPVPPPPSPAQRSGPPKSPHMSGMMSGQAAAGMPGERQPLLYHQFSSSSERQPHRSSRRNKHRRALSSSEAIPTNNYGAFFGDPQIPLVSNDDGARNPREKNFSPRGDFMTLTSSFRVTDSPRIASSPSSRKSPLPSTPLGPTSSSHGGGEAVFFATKARPESQRKRHMREQSAQLWVEDVKGEPQSSACRDVFFLLLFVFHLLFIVYLGNIYGHDALKESADGSFGNATIDTGDDDLTASSLEDGDPVTVYYKNLAYIAILCGPFAVTLSALMLGAMTLFSRFFVEIALFMVIALSFIWGTAGIGLSPKSVVPITGIICLALTVAYTFIVWDRIPFASANLMTALSGVYAFPGTIVVAFCFQALALAWSVYYSVVVFGVYDAMKTDDISVSGEMEYVIYVLLGISYYWTFQVLQNCVQVSTAGIIGGWWYDPSNSSIVRESCFKTFFYYMGSICFGSLFVGPVRIIRQLSGLFRPSSAERTSLMCLHECLHCIQTVISTCVDNISNNFSTWGFTYVGLYGYGFLDASYNSAVLFDKRGWTLIVSDDLVPNILLITSAVVGGITGCFAHVISQLDRIHVTSLHDPGLVSFAEGCVIGVVLTSVLFAVISGSVNTVLVCFAASPVEFERNHPKLSQEMRNAWREVWPGALDAVDLRLAMMAASNGASIPAHVTPLPNDRDLRESNVV